MESTKHKKKNPLNIIKTSRTLLLDYYNVSFVKIGAVMEVVSSQVAISQCRKSKIKHLNLCSSKSTKILALEYTKSPKCKGPRYAEWHDS